MFAHIYTQVVQKNLDPTVPGTTHIPHRKIHVPYVYKFIGITCKFQSIIIVLTNFNNLMYTLDKQRELYVV